MAYMDNNVLIEGVKFYLGSPSVGALLITGEWGSGKTYFIEHTLFDELKEVGRIPIKVSLFGMSDLSDLPKQIMLEYQKNARLDEKEQKSIGPWVDSIVDGITKLPAVQNVLGGVFSNATFLYNFIDNKKIVVFIDDIERAVQGGMDINDILGVVNSLVETFDYKVILIANENRISKPSGNEDLVFKEKVVDKTLVFEPNILKVYDTLLDFYSEDQHEASHFVKLMKLKTMQSIINPLSEANKDLNKELQNIRILKFAIKHFHPIYKAMWGEKKMDKDELRDALYIWNFVSSLSIEYKLNHIEYADTRLLDSYQPTLSFESIDLGDDAYGDGSDLFGEENSNKEEKKEKVEKKKETDLEFAKRFCDVYFTRRNLKYVFLKEIFDNITAGKNVDYEKLREELQSYFPKERDELCDAKSELDSLMSSMYTMTNEQIISSLTKIHAYFMDGKIRGSVDVVNAYLYILHFAHLIGVDPDAFKEAAKQVVENVYRGADVNYVMLTNLKLVKEQIHPDAKPFAEYVIKVLERRMCEGENEEKENLKAQFLENIDELCKQLTEVDLYTTPPFFNIPILHTISEEDIIKKIDNIQPKDILAINQIITSRLKQDRRKLQEETIFFEKFRDIASELCKSLSKPTDFMLHDVLLPAIESYLTSMEKAKRYEKK